VEDRLPEEGKFSRIVPTQFGGSTYTPTCNARAECDLKFCPTAGQILITAIRDSGSASGTVHGLHQYSNFGVLMAPVTGITSCRQATLPTVHRGEKLHPFTRLPFSASIDLSRRAAVRFGTRPERMDIGAPPSRCVRPLRMIRWDAGTSDPFHWSGIQIGDPLASQGNRRARQRGGHRGDRRVPAGPTLTEADAAHDSGDGRTVPILR